MSTINTRQNSRVFRLGLALSFGLALLLGLLVAMSDVQPVRSFDSARATPPQAARNNEPDAFPIITDTSSQQWIGISDNCVVYRDDRDGTWDIYLHKLSTGETFTVTADEPAQLRKVAISEGVVVWRSERAGAHGLWGYYNPACSHSNPFTPTTIITPFHIVHRTHAHNPELDGEILASMYFSPAGAWYVGLIELDKNDNGWPDALEEGYDPAAWDIWVRLSCCASWPQGYTQTLPSVYWGDEYKVACWYDSAGGDHIKCYDLSHDDDDDGTPDWKDVDFGPPWNGQFRVTSNTRLDFDWKGILAVHRDLVIWTDARDFDLSGYDLYVVDLDLDEDGILDRYDDDPGDGPSEFVLVNRPWHQQFPDLWWPFAVWSDRRNGNQEDIYAYDLSLDTDADGVPNWKDPDRFCVDPAELRVTSDTAAQTTPEIWNGTVVWIDSGNVTPDIYGAHLQPVQPQSRVPITGTARQKALHWLDQQTVSFAQVHDIPGYIAATGMITRYKSFTQNSVEQTRKAWYSPTVGSYVVSYDFCYYGTPDQKRYLGRFGRGFTYDQALALVARTMLSQPAQAQDLGNYVANLQNSGQQSTTITGSFGFSFNGQGFWDEKDNFYDMDYLRSGANGWLGYGLLFYARQHSDVQLLNVITRVADYVLDHQVISPTDPRHGLFKGGFGRWITQTDVFADDVIEWVAAEHNIDVYFFLRDLGQMTGDSRYVDAAQLLRANMPKLWDETKGRLNQGMGITGTLNTGDALDAASWGAMYWTAVGDLEKAKRSLEYADHAYRNTVTISDSGFVSSPISIWGYKPYTGTAEGSDWSTATVVWSEGSLGVAMASLKLGYALSECGDLEGATYIQKAKEIVAEMEKLQALDPQGGLFYAVSSDDDLFDFPQAPSAAGTTWLLMVQRAIEDATMRDAFWGRDPGIIHCATIDGPTMGVVHTPYTFSATASPTAAKPPITFVWQATGRASVTATTGLSHTIPFSWTVPGVKAITVTATNAWNTVTDKHHITIRHNIVYLPVVWK